MPTYWLNFHLPYACRHSGVCCSSGWPIPVERDRVIPIGALSARPESQWLLAAPQAPADVAGTLVTRPNGECTFFRVPTRGSLPTSRVLPSTSGSCAVHPARPASCAHFPYVCLIDQRGVHVTLSHYCPTAASLLFEAHGPIAIVEGPPPVRGLEMPEGLDARESLPPAFAKASIFATATVDRSAGRPHATKMRLMSWEEVSAWEQQSVSTASGGMLDPQVALASFEQARLAVAAPLDWPAAPADFARVWHQQVAPAWTDYAPVLARYRAAKLFASWALYLGDGPSAVTRAADRAMAVLQVEAVRQCASNEGMLDAELLKQAIRQSDLLLVHYADRLV